jgi:hypothetical protein
MSLDEAKFETLKQRMGTALAIVVSQTPLPPADQLVSAEWSWQFLLGIEGAVIGVVLLVVGRGSTKQTQPVSARVAISILAILLPFAGCHQASSTDQQVLDDDRTIDLGRVMQGTNLEANFRVRNRGNSPFRIERVERSCHCQDVRFDARQEVPPQGEATVAMVVPTTNSVGPIQHQFVVHTTAADPGHETITLTVKADVCVPLRAIPSEMMFGADAGTGGARQLRIETDPPELASQYSSVTAPDFFEVKLLNRDRGGLLFTVERSADAPKGTLNGVISVRFDHPEFPELNVPVTSHKSGPFRVIPSKLQVNGHAGEQTLNVLIASSTGQPFRLLSASTPGGATPVWEETKDPQKKYLIKVLVTNPESVNGKTITINTDLPEEHSILIPISVRNLH